MKASYQYASPPDVPEVPYCPRSSRNHPPSRSTPLSAPNYYKERRTSKTASHVLQLHTTRRIKPMPSLLTSTYIHQCSSRILRINCTEALRHARVAFNPLEMTVGQHFYPARTRQPSPRSWRAIARLPSKAALIHWLVQRSSLRTQLAHLISSVALFHKHIVDAPAAEPDRSMEHEERLV